MDFCSLVGIGSYAFRFAARKKKNPMDAVEFIEETAKLGLKRALICENMNYCDNSNDFYLKLRDTAAKHSIIIEVGNCDNSNDYFIKLKDTAAKHNIAGLFLAVCPKPCPKTMMT
jgi:hypothetical protein